jgi:hypothetical protein
VIGLELGLLTHLDAQLSSSRRLLEITQAQGEAIRLREADTVVALTAELQNELHRRRVLDDERARLLRDAALELGRPAHEVTLDEVCTIVSPGAADSARERSAELRAMLDQVAETHAINRALMKQELTFLSHLTRLLADDPEPGYAPPQSTGRPAAPGGRSLVDLEA